MQEQKRLMNGAQAAMQHMGTFERPSMLNKLKRISTRAPILTKINEGNQDKAHSKCENAFPRSLPMGKAIT
eukprot:scaffold251807_cov24-Tisochrysis_lutea.AAC.1